MDQHKFLGRIINPADFYKPIEEEFIAKQQILPMVTEMTLVEGSVNKDGQYRKNPTIKHRVKQYNIKTEKHNRVSTAEWKKYENVNK